MKIYICILRGINVSGHNLVKMDALKQLFEAIGFKNVVTYIQSGNVIFKYKDEPIKKIEHKITKGVNDKFGFDVKVIVLDIFELQKIVSENSFARDVSKDIAFMHVTFLAVQPLQENVKKFDTISYGSDEFVLKDKAIYLFCPAGYGKTKLNNSFFEKKFKVNATTRNWKTTLELLKMAEAMV